MVVGPEGEEIYVNEDGCVRVHFHWNRYDKPDENASCWIRVAQGWSGDNFGFLSIPRIGQEVLVSYLNGDIDRPIITGTTYNGRNRPPLDLPANKTQLTMKGKTHKGSGANEMRFEDEDGKQEFYIHAQKDMNTVVKNDQTVGIEAGNRTVEVKTGDEVKTITQGNLTENINNARNAHTKSITTVSDAGLAISGGLFTKIGSVVNSAIMSSKQAGMGEQLHMASHKITLEVGNGKSQMEMTLEKIKLTHGPSTISMTAEGIFIEAPVIHLNKDQEKDQE